jgi:hypothetical protein
LGAVPNWISSGARPSFGFYNQTAGSAFGSIQSGYSSSDGSTLSSGGGTCEAILTTSANTNIILAVLANSTGTLTQLGGNPEFVAANSYPWVEIQVIGGNAPVTFGSGALNYVQVTPAQVVIANGTAFPFNIASLSITTAGNPVQITCAVDFNPAAQAAWVRVGLYRGSLAIGQELQSEPGPTSGTNANIPFTITYIDNPPAGTYTYYCKGVTGTYAAGNFNFGEASGPTMYAIELGGAVGPTGAAGTMTTTAYTSPVVVTATTTNPTTGTRTIDSTSSLIIGDTRRITLRLGYPGSSGGSGEYLFQLPTGVNFNTAAGKNPIYTGALWQPTIGAMGPYLIPTNGSVVISGAWAGTIFVMPYTSTTYRIALDNAPQTGGFGIMGNAFFSMLVSAVISIEFNIWI